MKTSEAAAAAFEFDSLAQVMTARAMKSLHIPDAMDREDVLQEARVNLIELTMRHDPENVPLSAWLATSLPWAIWRSIRTVDHEKRSKRVQVFSVDTDEFWNRSSSHRVADEAVANVDCREILRLMPPDLRQILWWKYAEGYTESQIARKLGIPLEESQMLIKRAVRAARSAAQGRKRDVGADLDALLAVLREGKKPSGKIPGRKWVCKRTGFSELRYARLMAKLVERGLIVGRTDHIAGYLVEKAA